MSRALAFLLLAAMALGAQAQGTLEIIQLKHRPVDQVLPILRPLLEPGGALSGQSFQLIVRASPRNIAEIRQALEAIDTPARRLVISVRFDTAVDAGRSGASASVRAPGSVAMGNSPLPADRTQIGVRVHDSRSSLDERVDQRVQVLDGARAFISTGQSRPMPQREVIHTPQGTLIHESTVTQDIATGFEVVPRVSGGTVHLDINPQRQTFGASAAGAPAGSVQSQHVSSTVSARLGDWFELGGALGGSERDAQGIPSTARQRSSESRRVWVKVEEVRP